MIVWILIVAAIIAGILGEWVDILAIIVIVILNALLGFFQEYRAERSLAALRKMVTPSSKVIRDGKLQTLPSKRARIENLDTLSSHADYEEVLHWLKNLKSAPKRVFITHGELDAAESLKSKIE